MCSTTSVSNFVPAFSFVSMLHPGPQFKDVLYKNPGRWTSFQDEESRSLPASNAPLRPSSPSLTTTIAVCLLVAVFSLEIFPRDVINSILSKVLRDIKY